MGRIADAFSGTEWERKLWFVGGCVRDKMIGLKPSGDLDIAVEGDAVAAALHLFSTGVAKAEPQVYPRFGTAMVRIDSDTIEFASTRRESYDDDSRKPKTKPATISEDLYRRDFTINTLLLDPWTGEVLDLLGKGLYDLKKGILRTPVAPDLTFYDDPLRMLRAVRFRRRFNLEYAEDLKEAIPESASRLEIVSGERIHDEVKKMLQSPNAAGAVSDLRDLGLLDQIIPGARADADERVARCQGDYLAILASLFVEVPLNEVSRILSSRIRVSAKTASLVRLLLENEKRIHSGLTPIEARRLLVDLPDVPLESLARFAFSNADWQGEEGKVLGVIQREQREAEVSPLESPLSGAEIMELTGLGEGAEIGRIKDQLQAEVIEGRLKFSDKEQAQEQALEICRSLGPQTGVQSRQE